MYVGTLYVYDKLFLDMQIRKRELSELFSFEEIGCVIFFKKAPQ